MTTTARYTVRALAAIAAVWLVVSVEDLQWHQAVAACVLAVIIGVCLVLIFGRPRDGEDGWLS